MNTVTLKVTAQQEDNIMTYRDYSIKIEWSEDSIWGPEGTDSYDVDASLDNLADRLRERIEAEYPGVELDIDLTSIHDRIVVNGSEVATENDISVEVSEIGNQIWQEFDWAITMTESRLNELLENQTHEAHFQYDEEEGVWRLYGTTVDGLGWESDDFVEAESLEDAQQQAIDYLESEQEQNSTLQHKSPLN